MKNRFREARTEYNRHGSQSTKEVAAATGITKSLIEDIESTAGKPRDVGYLKVKKLAEYYGVSSDYLLGLSDTPSIDEDVQAACKTTGLSELSVKILLNAKQIGGCVGVNDVARVIDFLLWDECEHYPGHQFRSIINLLKFFLSYEDTQKIQKQVFTNGAFRDFPRDSNLISSNALCINQRVIENAVLNEIQQALISIKEKRQKEVLDNGQH